MFAYGKKMQLALSDKLRRAGLMAGAGAVLLIGAGFLLATLWTWLATHLGWGPLWASLAIGAGFSLIGLILLLLASRERHPTPSTDELRSEIEERANLMVDAALNKATGAADAAINRATQKATRLMGAAGQRVQAVSDQVAYGADRFADRAEAQAQTAAHRVREAAESGLGTASAALDEAAARAGRSRTAAVAPLIGAFAVGLTLASRLRGRRHQDDWDDPEDGA